MSTDEKNTTRLPEKPRWVLKANDIGHQGFHFVVLEDETARIICSLLGAKEDRDALREMVAARNLVRNQRSPRPVFLGDLLDVEAALLDESAELMALASCASCEATRLHWQNMVRLQEGRPVEPIVNVYAEILGDMLAGREVLPSFHTKDGSHG